MRESGLDALRIGEVARRTGVAAATLRAWQTRHGFPTPYRTSGGQRLYSHDDVERIRTVTQLVAEGWALPAAIRRVTAPPDAGDGTGTVPRGNADRDRPAAPRWQVLETLADVDAFAVLAAYECARALVRAATPDDVHATVVSLVTRLGGQVGPAGIQDEYVLPVDISFGTTEPLLPRATPGSIARMRLEAVLPLVVEDARLAAHRLQLAGPHRLAES